MIAIICHNGCKYDDENKKCRGEFVQKTCMQIIDKTNVIINQTVYLTMIKKYVNQKLVLVM